MIDTGTAMGLLGFGMAVFGVGFPTKSVFVGIILTVIGVSGILLYAYSYNM